MGDARARIVELVRTAVNKALVYGAEAEHVTDALLSHPEDVLEALVETRIHCTILGQTCTHPDCPDDCPIDSAFGVAGIRRWVEKMENENG